MQLERGLRVEAALHVHRALADAPFVDIVLIEHAEVVDESEMKADVVNLGSTVKVLDMEFEEEIEYSLVGTNEANPMQGKISDRSPIGSAMIGAKEGDLITVNTPDGELKFKILSVTRTKNNG